MLCSFEVLGSVKGARFDYLCNAFDSLSEAELKEYRLLCNIMRDAEVEEYARRDGMAQRAMVYSPDDLFCSN